MIEFPILSMLIIVPAVGALLVALLSRRRPEEMKLVATVASVATVTVAFRSSPVSRAISPTNSPGPTTSAAAAHAPS